MGFFELLLYLFYLVGGLFISAFLLVTGGIIGRILAEVGSEWLESYADWIIDRFEWERVWRDCCNEVPAEDSKNNEDEESKSASNVRSNQENIKHPFSTTNDPITNLQGDIKETGKAAKQKGSTSRARKPKKPKRIHIDQVPSTCKDGNNRKGDKDPKDGDDDNFGGTYFDHVEERV